jgi:archaellum component FlaC
MKADEQGTMKEIEANSQKGPGREGTSGDAAQTTTPLSHFKRNLVPLNEYAAREGIPSDIVEQQGQLGVIQIRTFKGQKFVVDVDPEQLSQYEAAEDEQNFPGAPALKNRISTSSKYITAGLTAGLIIIIVSVFWFYLDAKTRLDDLTAEHKALVTSYNNLAKAAGDLQATQQELANSKVLLSQIQNSIAQSKTDLQRIQADLNKSRRSLDTIQSDMTTIQGQISLSKVELESIRNGLNDSKNDLDTLHNQNNQALKK